MMNFLRLIFWNYKILLCCLLGLFLGYGFWCFFNIQWGAYPLSSECWVNCVYGCLFGGLIGSLFFQD